MSLSLLYIIYWEIAIFISYDIILNLMKAAVYYNNKDLRIEERPIPKTGPGELLIKVEASGICGSDVMEWYRLGRTPLILGHELSGVIEEVGPEVTKYHKGQKVACSHHVPCGVCHYCAIGHETVCDTLRRTNFDPGGFCEYLRLAKVNVEHGVFVLPDNVSFEEATFMEPLGCVLRGQRLAGELPGKSVLVIGSGIAGLLHIHLARARKASLIVATDIVDYRLKAAKNFGADASINAKDYAPKNFQELNNGKLADLVIVSSGNLSAIEQALASVERGGVVLFFAPSEKGLKVPVSFNDLFWRNEITLTSSYGAGPKDCQQALGLIASGKLKLKEMITHRLRLDEIGLGFKLVAEAKESIKVIVYPHR